MTNPDPRYQQQPPPNQWHYPPQTGYDPRYPQQWYPQPQPYFPTPVVVTQPFRRSGTASIPLLPFPKPPRVRAYSFFSAMVGAALLMGWLWFVLPVWILIALPYYTVWLGITVTVGITRTAIRLHREQQAKQGRPPRP
jgi:fatty acid desaturase